MTDTGDVLSMRIRPLNYLCRDPIGAAIQTYDVSLRPEALAKSGLHNEPSANRIGYQQFLWCRYAGRGVKTRKGSQQTELGHWDSKVLTSLVGLAAWSRDSGKKRGHRAIRGQVRRALYICVCVWAVIRQDSAMRRFYDHLRQRGEPGNVAMVAAMRKILLQLNEVACRSAPWVLQAGKPQILEILTSNTGT